MEERPPAGRLARAVEIHGELVARYWGVRSSWWAWVVDILKVLWEVLSFLDNPIWSKLFELERQRALSRW